MKLLYTSFRRVNCDAVFLNNAVWQTEEIVAYCNGKYKLLHFIQTLKVVYYAEFPLLPAFKIKTSTYIHTAVCI